MSCEYSRFTGVGRYNCEITGDECIYLIPDEDKCIEDGYLEVCEGTGLTECPFCGKEIETDTDRECFNRDGMCGECFDKGLNPDDEADLNPNEDEEFYDDAFTRFMDR